MTHRERLWTFRALCSPNSLTWAWHSSRSLVASAFNPLPAESSYRSSWYKSRGNDCFSPFHFFWSFIYLHCPWRWSFLKLHPVCLAACLCLVSCLFEEGLAERIPQPPLSALSTFSPASAALQTSPTFCLEWSSRPCSCFAALENKPQCLSLASHLESLLLTHCTSHVRAVRVCIVLQQDDTVNNLPYFLVLLWKWSKDRDLQVFDFHVCSNVGVCAERIWTWETPRSTHAVVKLKS